MSRYDMLLVRLKTAGSGPVSADADDYQIGLSSDPYGRNYDPSPGGEHGYYWLDFGSNQDVVTFSVQAVDDTRIEAGTETFKVVLMGGWPVSGQWGADVMDPSQAYGDIWENDEPSTFSVTASDNQGAEEGSDGLTFVISRPGELSYNEADVYLDLSGEAGEGSENDYTCDATGTGTRRSVHFSSGQTSATFCLTPVDDEEVEEAESVIVTLAADPDACWRGFATYEVAGAPGNEASGEIADNELQLELEGPVITEGLTEEFTLWVRDPFGAPIGGKRVTVDIDQQNGDKIETSTVEVVTTAEGSATGSATFSITGKLTGTAKIGLQPEGKARREKNVVVGQPTLVVEAPPFETVLNGQVKFQGTLFKADGVTPIPNRAVAIELPNNQFAEISSKDSETRADGKFQVIIKGKSLTNNPLVPKPTLTITVPNSTLDPVSRQIGVGKPVVHGHALTAVVGLGREFAIRVETSTGMRVSGISVALQVDNVLNVELNPTTIQSDESGIVRFTANANSSAELTWTIGDDSGTFTLSVSP